MRILTLDNKSYNLTDLPAVVEEDIRFCVLDNSIPTAPDFFFLPLMFMESFNAPAIVIQIGGYQIQMPLDWCIVIGDQDCGLDPEVIPLTSINEREFDAFVMNPISGFDPQFLPISIVNIFQDVEWFFPKLKNAHYLAVPLGDEENPLCAYFVNAVTRQSEIIKLDLII